MWKKSDPDNLNEDRKSFEVTLVSGEEGKSVRMRGGGNEEIGDARPVRTSRFGDGGHHESVTSSGGYGEGERLKDLFDLLDPGLTAGPFKGRAGQVRSSRQFRQRHH